jgi:hypothetical protein
LKKQNREDKNSFRSFYLKNNMKKLKVEIKKDLEFILENKIKDRELVCIRANY